MSKARLWWLWPVSAWLASLSSVAAAGSVERLENYLAGLESLKARFSQTIETRDAYTGPLEGTFYLQRPGQFRWEYDGGEGQLIVADGERIWLLDRELEQVSHQSQKDALRGTPAQLLAESGALAESFEAEDAGDMNGLSWIDLRPSDPESQFSLVRVAFRGDGLDRLEMLDNFGQYTRFVLSDVERNVPLDKALFRFDPPQGWDVFQTH
jgi:outer membrane lipoprotein carrier protein